MEMKPVGEIPKKHVKRRSSRYEEILKQFLDSGQAQMEIVLGGDDPKPNTVYQRLSNARKKLGIEGVKIVKRNVEGQERIFLVRV